MSPSTITLIFLAFAIVSFVLEKIPLGLTATIVAIGLNILGITKLKVMNYMPAVFLPIVLCLFM